MAIYFYKEFGTLGYLANYSSHGFYKDGIFYKTVEHFYQSKKFLNKELQEKIINADTPKEASNIGRDRNNKLRDNWSNIKQDIMLEGVLEKFRQNKDILIKLLNTGEEDIIENTVDEYYWGCGKDKSGENNFGKIVVKARDILKKEEEKKLNDLKKIGNIYILGHNNIDFDSYFSSYILSSILTKLGINAIFTILDDYIIGDENKDIINDYKLSNPFVLNRVDLNNKNFILVDHNDISQSLNNNNCNVLYALDHHIDSKNVKECYSVEYTSTLLYIYDLFKNLYVFSDKEKELIALSVMTDSEYLTTSRFKDSDKALYNELNVNIDPKKIQSKYFKTTDFNLSINYNIKNNFKTYNINNHVINRVVLKAYEKDNLMLENYLIEFNKLYDNTLLIWNEYDTLKTKVYYNSKLVKEYNYILTSSVLIIKDLINENIIKEDKLEKYNRYN